MPQKPARPALRKGPAKPKAGFPIVGVGASAGGLEAFTELVAHLPAGTGMAFVLVQHLAPSHESALVQLLRRAASMPVREVANQTRVQANHVYVIPPNTQMAVAQGVLNLTARPPSRSSLGSIDFFFASLAEDLQERAIGVVLSGTATDGTQGLEDIKAAGGITFAQDATAKYDSMPASAAASGCVDFILSPENIARELVRISRHPYVSAAAARPGAARRPAGPSAEAPVLEPVAENGFKKILLLLRKNSGVDFSLYKRSTIHRRIARRMVLNRIDQPEAYANHLRGDPKEINALYLDLLINVTSFFRNPEAFEALKRKVFPQLVEENRHDPIRVWIIGCSTGQEAYSLAMSFVEFAGRSGHSRKLQIFATDVSEAGLEKSRAGFYPGNLIQAVSRERLARFFVEEGNGYRVAKFLREMIIFARHNLLVDPPFSRMDLIHCRNLLIYFHPDLQRKVLPSLHYALKPGRFLFLGESESVVPWADLFDTVDKKRKIFSKKTGASPHLHFAPRHPAEAGKLPEPRAPAEPPPSLAPVNILREADRVMLKRYGPAGVLINAHSQILQFRGETSRFLKPPVGDASYLQVLKMARDEIMLPLRSAIKEAREHNRVVRREGVRLPENGESRLVNFEVVPLIHLKERYCLVLFEEDRRRTLATGALTAPEPLPARKRPAVSKEEEAGQVAGLERELVETRDYLQSLQDQYEASNEELQSSNEEITSANEELQSINEELETSKEEIESTNEELTTVNEEMLSRNAELNRLNSDLNNLNVSIKTAILLLGRDLTVRRFTPPAEDLFNLTAGDAGRLLGNVRHNLDLPGLESLIHDVIDTVSPRETEVQDLRGRWYSLRIRPYTSLDNKIDGAVLVVVDIDALKRSEQEIKAARDYAEAVLRAGRTPLLILRPDLRVNTANDAYYQAFLATPAETENRLVYELGQRQFDLPKLRELLAQVLSGDGFFSDFQVWLDFEKIGRRTLLLNARRMEASRGQRGMIVLALEDVTEREHARQDRQAREFAETVIHTTRDPLVILNPDLSVRHANEAFYKTFPLARDRTEGRFFYDLGRGEWNIPRLRELLEGVLPRNSFFNDFQVMQHHPPRPPRTLLLDARPMELPGADRTILVGIADITESLVFQAEVRRAEVRYRRLFETAREGIVIVDPVTRKITDANPFVGELLGCSREELLGQELWQIGLLKDESASHAVFRDLQTNGAARYDNWVMNVKRGREYFLAVIANLYPENERSVVQFNLRDITERQRAQESLLKAQSELRSNAERLDQSNRLAVERETLLLELKREVNDLSREFGQPPKYPEAPGG